MITATNKSRPELQALRLAVEKKWGQQAKTPADFEQLALAIWNELHENISPTTLKRLWGYIDGGATIRRSTLCLLAQYIGYADWEHFLQQLEQEEETESETFTAEGIGAEELEKGALLRVCWLPNRECVFRYDGENVFTVVANSHSKLQEGDRFRTAGFRIGQPLYADELIRKGEEAPTRYVAGKKHGITAVERP